MLMSFDFPEISFILRSPYFCSVVMVLVAYLMVSRIPTISLKKTKISSDWFLPIMILLAMFVSCLITKPWLTLGLFTLCYMLSVPFTVVRFMREKKAYEESRSETAE